MSPHDDSPPPARRARPADPYAPFRPGWGRVVPLVSSVAVLAVAAAGALTIPGEQWTPLDRGFLFLLGLAASALLLRYGLIEARPSPAGLVVRNLLTTRRLEWAEILRMQFGRGAPWVTLDLADTDVVAVMAIQKADGARGRANAARLAALLRYHSGPGDPPEVEVAST